MPHTELVEARARLAADGRLTRGDEVGRNAHFTAGPTLRDV